MTPWQLNAIYSFPARLSLDDMWKGLTLFAPWSNPIWSVRMVKARNPTPPLHQPPLVNVSRLTAVIAESMFCVS